CSLPLAAEAKALLSTLIVAAHSGLRSIIKIDCLVLVDAVDNKPESWPWQCRSWFFIMRDILRNHPFNVVSFIPKRLNTMADKIAKAAAPRTLIPN
ncbi:hypothetical protein LINPERHAP1_LOCUS30936, partial [Linum perenne]